MCTCLSGHPSRLAFYLTCQSQGQFKLISCVRSALIIADFSTTSQKELNRKICIAKDALGDIKTLFELMTVPSAFPSLTRKCFKAHSICKKVVSDLKQKKHIGPQAIIKLGSMTCEAVKKTLSLTGKLIFKPLKLAGRCGLKDEHMRKLAESWKYITIVKMSFKAGYLCGCVALGRNAGQKIVRLILVIGKILENLFKLCKVHIHTSFFIILVICHTLFDVYTAYQKTA